eukprot:c15941_g1_i3 orf=38-214(+)
MKLSHILKELLILNPNSRLAKFIGQYMTAACSWILTSILPQLQHLSEGVHNAVSHVEE